jgi:hypothetical protein
MGKTKWYGRCCPFVLILRLWYLFIISFSVLTGKFRVNIAAFGLSRLEKIVHFAERIYKAHATDLARKDDGLVLGFCGRRGAFAVATLSRAEDMFV